MKQLNLLFYLLCALSLLVGLATLIKPVVAFCECGYSTALDMSSLRSPPIESISTYRFTDLIESDFIHIRNISLDTDWKRQDFAMTPALSRGPYGYVSAPPPDSHQTLIFETRLLVPFPSNESCIILDAITDFCGDL